MKWYIWIITLFLSLTASGAQGIVIDGDLTEWGVTPNSDLIPTYGVSYWIEDSVGSQGYVGPGYGGQSFDAEAIYAYLGQQDLYIAMVVGMPPGGAYSNGGIYYPGDLALDMNGDGVYEYGLELTGWSGNSANGNTNHDTYDPTKLGNLYRVLDSKGWNEGLPLSNKTETELNYRKMKSLELVGSTTVVYANSSIKPDSYIIETSIPYSLLDVIDGAGATLHWTMTCGNDIAEVTVIGFGETDFGPPSDTSVPEPATMLLCALAAGMTLMRIRVFQ